MLSILGFFKKIENFQVFAHFSGAGAQEPCLPENNDFSPQTAVNALGLP